MAIYYFNKSLILALLILFTPLELMAQTVPKKVAKKSISKRSASKSTVSLKLDEQGRAYFIDQQGDKVVVLDYKTRKSIQAVANYNKLKDKDGKLNSQSFYKESVPDFVEEVKPGFKKYISKQGDTWVSISKELYDTDTQWAQLKLWNEELLNRPNIPAGTNIKYMDLKK